MEELDQGATIRGMAAGQRVVNRYVLVRMLGRGGMGVVWLAKDEELGRETALKFLPEMLTLDRAAISDLKREVRRAIDLAHPNIVKIHDFITDSRTSAVSMEYVTGDTLSSRRVDQPGQVFTPAGISIWVAQLCSALDYAHHDAEVVHRDLKPSNLMIDAKGKLKVLDFGIAASISDSVSRVSNKASSSGTPIYMSPQQMMGEEPAVTDDVYALGATLFELLAGKPPFHSGNILVQVQNKVAPLLNDRRRAAGLEPVPAEWETTLAACLAKDPALRPQSAGEVAERLGLLAAGTAPRMAPRLATPAPPPVVPLPAAAPPPVAAPARPPQATANQLAKRALKITVVLALIVDVLVLVFAAISSAASENWGEIFLTILIADFTVGLFTWFGLWLLMIIWRAVFGIKAPPVALPKPAGLPWVRAAVAGSFFPCVALTAWPLYHSFSFDADTQRMGGVLAGAALAWPVHAVLFALLQLYLLARKARRLRDYALYFATTGGVMSACAYAAGIMPPGSMELGGGDLLAAGFAAAVAWGLGGAVAHYQLFKERPVLGRNGGLILGGAALAVAAAGYILFISLPNDVQLVEYRAAQEQKRLATEEQVRTAARLAQEQAAKQAREEQERAVRLAQATTMVKEAYQMVFDRAPDLPAQAAYIKKLIDNPALGAAQLRQEMRASAEGQRGGRLLVPEEFKTIQAAIAAAGPGNVVHVAGGTYAEALTISANITLVGEGRDAVIVENDASASVLYVLDQGGATISGITFRHTSTTETDSRYSAVSIRANGVRFEGNRILAANGHGLDLTKADNAVVRDNVISGSRWSGISVYEGSSGEISGNEISSNEQSGLYVNDLLKRLTVSNNTFRNNGSCGISLPKGDGVVLLSNNLSGNSAVGNNAGGIWLGGGRPVLRGNVSQGNHGTGIWWSVKDVNPRIEAGNVSDGQTLPTTN